MSKRLGHNRMNIRSIAAQLETVIVHGSPPTRAPESLEVSRGQNGTGTLESFSRGSPLKKLPSQGSVDLFSAEFEECIGDNETLSVANSLAELRVLDTNSGQLLAAGSMDSESWPAPPENLDQFPEEYLTDDSIIVDRQSPPTISFNGGRNIETIASRDNSYSHCNSTDNQPKSNSLLRRPQGYENVELAEDSNQEELYWNKPTLATIQNSSNLVGEARAFSSYENVEMAGKQLSLIAEASIEDYNDITPTNSLENIMTSGAIPASPPPLVSRETVESHRPSCLRSRKQYYENVVLPLNKNTENCTGTIARTKESEFHGARQIDIIPHRNLPPANVLRNQMQKQPALSIDSAQSDISADDVFLEEANKDPSDVFDENLAELSDEDSWYSDSDFDSDEDECHSVSFDRMSLGSSDGWASSEEYKDQTLGRTAASKDPLIDLLMVFIRSERAYVDKLHFICRVVLLNLKILDRIPDVCSIKPEVYQQIFSNVEEIHAYHSGNLLPKLEERANLWQYNPRLGDLLKEMIPHLSLYLQYTENFKKSQSIIDQWCQKNAIFNALIQEAQKTPECRRLTVKQHLLDVIHRVPKYQALAKDYLDHLSVESDDWLDTSEASASLNQAGLELERAMGKDERIKKLKEIQQRLETKHSLLSSTREFLKEGKIKTVNVKGDSTLERYIFLFSDILMICGRASFGGGHKVKKIIELDGMQIYDGDNLIVPHTFYIQSRTKAIEFHASSAIYKREWAEAIRSAMDSYMTWKLAEKPLTGITAEQEEELGKLAPSTLTRKHKAMCCKLCGATFGSVRKRNECKACGQIFCARCCTQKARLEYDSNRLNRVCDECYIIIRHRDLGSDVWETPETSVASVEWRMSGSLQLTGDRGSHWKKRWFTLRSDGFLLCYKKKGDKDYLTSLPLKRFTVGITTKSDPIHKACSFKLHNLRKKYFFISEDLSVAERWLEKMADFTNSSI